ncbi:MAG: bifunctional nuclease family protein [Chloroflexi bacterium]|nr:bifunctional nuclease family protein [Chloroflexota bacterium]
MSSSASVPAVATLRLIAVTHRFLSDRDAQRELERTIGKLPADLRARLLPEKLQGMVQRKRRYLILQEIGGARVLAISAGEVEATAASMWLGGIGGAIPSTYGLMARLVERGDRHLERALIDDVTAEGLTAKLVLTSSHGEGSEAIPCRPADAVNLSVRLDAPIVAAPAVLLFAGYAPNAGGDELVRAMPGVPLPDLPDRMAMPQPVAPGSYQGPRSLEDVLARIARSEVVVVDQPDGFVLVPVPPDCIAEAEAVRLMGSRGRLDEAIRRGLVHPRFTPLGDRRAGPFFTRTELDRLQSGGAGSW